MSQSGYVHIDDVRIIRETDKALLIGIDNEDFSGQVWIPWSQIADPSEYKNREGETGVNISVTEWIAEQKGIPC